MLQTLIVPSSLPLKAVETVFAPDSTGLSTRRFVRWFDEKYGTERSGHDWVQAHAICGVKTNIVTSVEIHGRDANDCPYFKPLVEATAQNFKVEEVAADKGYLMGWTNSHLHHFRVGQQLYGDPLLMQENFEEMEYEDSTATTLSDILPKSGGRFRFEYDFGDGWRHEVLFEGCVRAERDKRYPICLEGARACPPEDVGGVWGYQEFLETITDPEHEDHDGLLEWAGGSFDPEAFDPAAATREMHRGLPDWRSERWV